MPSFFELHGIKNWLRKGPRLGSKSVYILLITRGCRLGLNGAKHATTRFHSPEKEYFFFKITLNFLFCMNFSMDVKALPDLNQHGRWRYTGCPTSQSAIIIIIIQFNAFKINQP